VRTEIALPLVLARVLAAVVQIEQASPGADLRGLDHCYQIVAECERLDDPGMPV
jgi:hypothetical protein